LADQTIAAGSHSGDFGEMLKARCRQARIVRDTMRAQDPTPDSALTGETVIDKKLLQHRETSLRTSRSQEADMPQKACRVTVLSIVSGSARLTNSPYQIIQGKVPAPHGHTVSGMLSTSEQKALSATCLLCTHGGRLGLRSASAINRGK
jgi:hypothetical protein